MQPAGPRCIFMLFIVLAVLLGNSIHRHHWKYVTEGSVALLLGLYAGGMFYLLYEVLPSESLLPPRLIEFDEDMFFGVLLPPIIFYAGFSVKKQLFFHQFLTLVMFGVVGTMLMAGMIGAGAFFLLRACGLGSTEGLIAMALSLGAIFASTDTVAALQTVHKDKYPVLHSLVFGEGVVNDATSIVLLSAIKALDWQAEGSLGITSLLSILATFARLFVLSSLLGVAVGLLSAAIIRHIFHHHSTNREVLVVALLGNISYAAAEALSLSPILAVFFAGITMSHYTWHSLSVNAQVITRKGFHVIASIAELVLFMYAGMDMWSTALWPTPVYTNLQAGYKIATLSGGLLLLMIASRAAFTFPIIWLGNVTWRRQEPLTTGEVAVMWLSGLPRGAITLALTYQTFYDSLNTQPDHKIIIAAAVLIVLVTTVGFGAGLGPAIDHLLHSPMTFPPELNPGVEDAELAIQTEVSVGTDAAESGGEEESLQTGLLGQQLGVQGVGRNTCAPRESDCGYSKERTKFHSRWRSFDAQYVQPIFGGSKAPLRLSSLPQRPTPRS